MNDSLFLQEAPNYWIFIFIATAGIFSFLLYYKQTHPWSAGINRVLGLIRFLSIFFILLLLLDIFFSTLVRTQTLPTLAVVIDNSLSMVAGKDSTDVRNLPKKLAEKFPTEINAKFYSLDGKPWDWNSSQFNGRQSNLYQTLKSIEIVGKSNPLAGIILLTDGIYNSGISPAYSQLNFPLFTIAAGDTSSIDDIQIADLRTNTLTYQGNKVPVEAYIKVPVNWKAAINVSLFEGKKLLDSKQITGDSRRLANFQIEAKTAGLKQYSIRVEPLPKERNLTNNTREFVLDVVEGKDHILFVSNYPHPDILAIRAALALSENYETSIYLPGISESSINKPVDVVVWYGAFSSSTTLPKLKGNPAHFYITDERSDLKALSEKTGIVISRTGTVADIVRPVYNEPFILFKLPEGTNQIIENWPGLQVPFGNYTLPPRSQVLLFQKLGGLNLNKPIFTFIEIEQQKLALMNGTGFWKWRMQESATQGNTKIFDEIFLKSIQYLSIKNEKRKLIVRPASLENAEDIPLSFVIECYNALYERVSGQLVSLQIKSETDSLFSFQFSSDIYKNTFEIGSLPVGNYTYTATSVNQTITDKTSGNFLVTSYNKELEDLEANHHMLESMSKISGGQYFHISNWEAILPAIKNENLKPQLSVENKLLPMRRWVFWLILILALLSTEWVIRRYQGGY